MVARTGVGEATRSQHAVRIGFAQVATLAALAGGVSGAWVLVVEILR